MITLPCISIRQPWAWAILNVGKDVENRTWTTRYRGPLLIHAAKGCTRNEYDDALDFIDAACGMTNAVPAFEELDRGGIVGAADLFGVSPRDDVSSPWKVPGQYGLRLGAPIRLEYRPYAGALGLFRVELTAGEVIALRIAGLLERP